MWTKSNRFQFGNCPKCGVAPGQFHTNDCTFERCACCGQQFFCDGVEERIAWAGEYSGLAECREYGIYCREVEGKGIMLCSKDDPGAVEDLNTLSVLSKWNRKLKKYVVKNAQLEALRGKSYEQFYKNPT